MTLRIYIIVGVILENYSGVRKIGAFHWCSKFLKCVNFWQVNSWQVNFRSDFRECMFFHLVLLFIVIIVFLCVGLIYIITFDLFLSTNSLRRRNLLPIVCLNLLYDLTLPISIGCWQNNNLLLLLLLVLCRLKLIRWNNWNIQLQVVFWCRGVIY